jgi:hypothetical protein
LGTEGGPILLLSAEGAVDEGKGLTDLIITGGAADGAGLQLLNVLALGGYCRVAWEE